MSGNLFEFVNADELGDFAYPGNWVDLTSPTAPYPFGPPGPTDVALVLASGTISGSANVSQLILEGDGGLLTSTLQFTTQVLVLAGSVDLSVPDYSTITDEVEETGASTVTMIGGGLDVNNPTAGTTDSTVFDIGISSGYQSTFNMAGAATEIVLNEGNAVIGEAGIGAMTFSSGAELLDLGSVILGNQTGSQGSLTVTGESSTVIADGALTVGNGGDGSLSILSGGLVECGSLNTGEVNEASGSILVSGPQSQLFAGAAYVGSTGPASSMTIADGGLAKFSTLEIGFMSNASVMVEGVGSTLRVNGYFGIGDDYGQTSSLQVTAGAQVVVQSSSVMQVAVANFDVSISVSGTGSLLQSTSGTMELGWYGTAAVTISSGGKMVTSTTGGPAVTLGNGISNPEETGKGVVTINGPGSNWNVTGEFDVGYNTNGTLLVEAGGSIETGNYDGVAGFVVGNSGGQPGFPAKSAGTATITGTGSTLTNNGDFVIGMYGSGTLAVSSGAVVSTTSSAMDGAIVGEYAGSIGAVSVSGGAKWTINPDLVIGAYGAGSLNISAGSTVSAGSLLMGITGAGHVDISGTGAKLAVSGNAEFGNSGNASVIINSGGELSVGSTAELKEGYISLYGGTLDVSKTLTLDAGQALGGYGNVQASSTISSTTVSAGSGTLSFIGGITGTGKLEIDLGATLSLGGSVGSGQETIFESSTSKLVLGAPASFAGTIYDFIKGDTIDLSKLIASSLTYSGQTLTVHESAGASLALKFAGSYAQSSFGMTSDGHSGTFVTHT